MNHGLGVTLASVLIQIQASIVNTELAHAAEQAGFVEISPKLIVQKDESDTISSARGVWNSENTTIFAKENESKLYCVCGGAGSDADTTIRRRYLWPPICEIIQTIAPVTFSKALGPFRSSIQISFETKNVTVVVNKQTGKRKRENNDTGMVNTVDTNQAVIKFILFIGNQFFNACLLVVYGRSQLVYLERSQSSHAFLGLSLFHGFTCFKSIFNVTFFFSFFRNSYILGGSC